MPHSSFRSSVRLLPHGLSVPGKVRKDVKAKRHIPGLGKLTIGGDPYNRACLVPAKRDDDPSLLSF